VLLYEFGDDLILMNALRLMLLDLAVLDVSKVEWVSAVVRRNRMK
jgi:hypothetical protein